MQTEAWLRHWDTSTGVQLVICRLNGSQNQQTQQVHSCLLQIESNEAEKTEVETHTSEQTLVTNTSADSAESGHKETASHKMQYTCWMYFVLRV